MRDGSVSIGGKNKVLTVILIAANLLMLVVGIITIPPNLRGTANNSDALAAIDSKSPVAEQEPSSFDLSTEERPDLEDFLWYTESVFYDDVPTDAVFIESFDVLAGGWKGLIIYDPENIHGANAMEFLNVNIAGTEDNLSLTLDWYLMFISGSEESLDETDMYDSVFDGKWEEASLWASGAGTIHLKKFYELRNKQYAIGTMDTPDGMPAFIALVRP